MPETELHRNYRKAALNLSSAVKLAKQRMGGIY